MYRMPVVMAKKRPKPVAAPDPVNPWTPERIRQLRELAEMTQAEAAEQVSVGQGVWSDWEAGKRHPSRQSARLLDIFEKSLKKK